MVPPCVKGQPREEMHIGLIRALKVHDVCKPDGSGRMLSMPFVWGRVLRSVSACLLPSRAVKGLFPLAVHALTGELDEVMRDQADVDHVFNAALA